MSSHPVPLTRTPCPNSGPGLAPCPSVSSARNNIIGAETEAKGWQIPEWLDTTDVCPGSIIILGVLFAEIKSRYVLHCLSIKSRTDG
jgi:hypothetical protein